MTLSNLIKKKTGWTLKEFCQRYTRPNGKKLNYTTMRQRALPTGSKAKRTMPFYIAEEIGEYINVAPAIVLDVCNGNFSDV